MSNPSPPYETVLNYLHYEDSSDRIGIPIRIRERHITEDTETVLIQAIGAHLQFAIRSERDDILIRCPFDRWYTSRCYEGNLSGPKGGYISIGRFEEYLDDRGTEDGGREISAMVFKTDIWDV